jgi:predicted membrane-bound spermidine synthase
MKNKSKPMGRLVNYRAYEILIFLTGAVTLALEVLSSRIMTPYFGVSLYIWAGILSITLIFLAIGYHWGGRLSRGREPDSLQVLLLSAPLAAALSMVMATALYPIVFPFLSETNLILASFLGSFLLLALPLITLSAMNPLLISLERDTQQAGDGGAGRIFFISTMGSVVGVLLTAFGLIPYLTNFRALLWITLVLSLAVTGLAWRNKAITPWYRRRFVVGGLCVALLCLPLLLGQRQYTKLLTDLSDTGKRLEVLGEYTSVFGNIKVVALRPDAADSTAGLFYLQDGIIQNFYSFEGLPLDHTNVLMRLIEVYALKAREALILGLGAGFIPQDLHKKGMNVAVVEINPRSIQAAKEFFHFKPNDVNMYVEDARTFVRRHKNSYDVVVIDLFQGDSTPDYLLTREFFQDLQASLQPGGIAVINAFFDPVEEPPNDRLLATIAAAFPHILEFRAPSSAGLVRTVNLIAANTALSPQVALEAAQQPYRGLTDKDFQTLKSVRQINRQMLAQILPVSDDHNIFSVLLAGSQLRYRSQFNKLPFHLLVN